METSNKKKTKLRRAVIIIAAAAIVAVLVIPVKYRFKDGGTVQWKAITWECYKYHRFADEGRTLIGTEINVLGINVFDDTHLVDPNEG